MTYLDMHKKQGAAINRRMNVINPYAVYCKLRHADPSASDAVMQKKWFAALAEDEDIQEAVNEYVRYTFENQYMHDTKKPEPRKTKTAKEVQQERAVIARVVNKARMIVLMDMELPNGKKLKDCTFKECSEAGGWFKLLATRGKPSEIVGQKLTEQDLQKLK